jgi:hypothetical protein
MTRRHQYFAGMQVGAGWLTIASVGANQRRSRWRAKHTLDMEEEYRPD